MDSLYKLRGALSDRDFSFSGNGVSVYGECIDNETMRKLKSLIKEYVDERTVELEKEFENL